VSRSRFSEPFLDSLSLTIPCQPLAEFSSFPHSSLKPTKNVVPRSAPSKIRRRLVPMDTPSSSLPIPSRILLLFHTAFPSDFLVSFLLLAIFLLSTSFELPSLDMPSLSLGLLSFSGQ